MIFRSVRIGHQNRRDTKMRNLRQAGCSGPGYCDIRDRIHFFHAMRKRRDPGWDSCVLIMLPNGILIFSSGQMDELYRFPSKPAKRNRHRLIQPVRTLAAAHDQHSSEIRPEANFFQSFGAIDFAIQAASDRCTGDFYYRLWEMFGAVFEPEENPG